MIIPGMITIGESLEVVVESHQDNNRRLLKKNKKTKLKKSKMFKKIKKKKAKKKKGKEDKSLARILPTASPSAFPTVLSSSKICSECNKEIPFTTIAIGTLSGIKDYQNLVVRSTEEWTKLWAKHKTMYGPPPPLPTPSIDFTSSLIISIFRGTQSTGGYSIEITSIQEMENRIVVTYETEDPGPSDFVTLALTQPFHIIEIPFTTKKVEFVRVHIPPPPPPFPEFFVFYDKQQSERIHTIMDELQEMETVSDIRILSSSRICIIQFNSDKTSKEDALKLLEEKLKDVTVTIVAEPPVSSW